MKLNKIKLALFSAGMLVSAGVFAADTINGGANSTALSTSGTASSWGDTSTAVGDGSIAGGDTTGDSTDFISSINLQAYSSLGNGTPGLDGTVIKDADGNAITDISTWAFNGDNSKSVAIGSNAQALYGEVNGTTTSRRYSASTAIGADTLSLNGGTAIGNEAWAIGRDSVAVGKEAKAWGNKTVVMGEDASASANYATAVGNGAAASATNASAFGVDSVAAGEDSTALGAGASATGTNSVALGAGSAASRDNTVSVGSAGAERTVSNVADGIYATDAVNLRQLENVEKKLSSGIAAAMAFTVPQFAPGKSNAIAMGAAHYNGASAMSLNLAHKFTEELIGTAGVAKGFNSASTSRGSSDDIGIKASVSWSF